MNFKEQIDTNRLPKHIAIIMDGNGRWAKERGKMRVFGHENGVAAVRNTAEAAAEIGIEFVTLYAFSTENWKRPQKEVDALMNLLVKTINKETETLNKNKIRLKAIGDLKSLKKETYAELLTAMENTSANNRMTMTLALSYSSRWEIVEAVKQIAEKTKNGELEPQAITSETITQHLSTNYMPDPELLIRTSGEQRISNYLLWQIAYSELYFCPKYWPDFEKEDFYKAIVDFQTRERRFGKTSEQITK
ncbi:MAG TPA: isoprenyl transferase [Bacteroidales bacterium]|jgi:undecaprenyl diphosphate synthase|nr:isoprenyl transferase [Bacteroidales bacterium]